MFLHLSKQQKTPALFVAPFAFAICSVCADENPVAVLAPGPQPEQTHITADDIIGTMKTQIKAQGNAVVTRDDEKLVADWLEYYQNQNYLKAGEHFVFTRPNETIEGSCIDYYLDSHTGLGQNPSFTSQQSGETFRGAGETIEFKGKKQYRINQGWLTSCPQDDDSWTLKSSKLDLNYITGVGAARHAQLYFKHIPILYSPWMTFALDKRRKSGFLYPTFRGGSNGFEILLPYYWNIAPNYDATITPIYNLKHGAGFGGEFRYLQPAYAGTIITEQVPYDQVTKTYRYLWSGQHSQTLAPGLTAGYEATKVSDDHYFNDFGNRTTVATNVNLMRQGWANYHFGWLGGSANSRFVMQRYQTLQSTGTTNVPPYALLPQISLNGTQALPLSLAGDLQSSFSYFSHPINREGNRLILYPSVTLPFMRMWGYIKPKFGFNYTHYQLTAFNAEAAQDITRSLPIFSTDAMLIFERSTHFFGTSSTQTLEPRLFYLNIPTVQQSTIPNFDTSENDVGFAQIFSENKFSGGDKINSANDITAGVTSKFIDNDSGRVILYGTIAQRYYFRKNGIDLSGNIIDTQGRSDILLGAGGEIAKNVHVDSLYQYNTKTKLPQQYYLTLRYTPAQAKVAALRYRFNRNKGQVNAQGQTEDLHEIDLGIQWPIIRKWTALLRTQYSIPDKQLLDQLYGVEYHAGCWVLRFITERYITDLTQRKNSYYVQLELKGLGSLGSDPDRLLRLAIPGYSSQ